MVPFHLGWSVVHDIENAVSAASMLLVKALLIQVRMLLDHIPLITCKL